MHLASKRGSRILKAHIPNTLLWSQKRGDGSLSQRDRGEIQLLKLPLHAKTNPPRQSSPDRTPERWHGGTGVHSGPLSLSGANCIMERVRVVCISPRQPPWSRRETQQGFCPHIFPVLQTEAQRLLDSIYQMPKMSVTYTLGTKGFFNKNKMQNHTIMGNPVL